MNLVKQRVRNLASSILTFLNRQSDQLYYEELIRNNELNIGKFTYGRPIIESYKGSKAKVNIGNYCSISKNVIFITGGIHPIDWVSTYPFRIRWNLDGKYMDGMPYTKGDIHIGSDVWIGTNAMIFSGVKIGDGAVISARAIVTSDIPPYAIAAGTPAKINKYRFDQDTIQKLLEIKWWEWNDEKILENIFLLSSKNIDKFLDIHYKNNFEDKN